MSWQSCFLAYMSYELIGASPCVCVVVCVCLNGNSIWHHWEIRKVSLQELLLIASGQIAGLYPRSGETKWQGSLVLEYLLPLALQKVKKRQLRATLFAL